MFDQRDNLFFALCDANTAFDAAIAKRDRLAADGQHAEAGHAQSEVQTCYRALIAAQDAYNAILG